MIGENYFGQIMNMLASVISTSISWFVTVMDTANFTSFYLAAFFLFLLGKYLISPLFGSVGSDKAKRRKE